MSALSSINVIDGLLTNAPAAPVVPAQEPIGVQPSGAADGTADRIAALERAVAEKDVALARLQQQLDQAQQQLTAQTLELQQSMQIAKMKEDGQTQRKLMDLTSRAHNVETITEGRVNDANLKAVTQQNMAEIDAITKLLLKRMDTSELAREIQRRNAEQQQYTNFSEIGRAHV